MAYTQLNLTNGTVLNADHMSHIEQGIKDNETQIEALKTEVNNITTQIYNALNEI